jgi:hypothetical protein
MTIDSRDFAAISDDTYKDRAVGRRAPGKEEHVTLNGHEYKILEHVNNRLTGYQGTVYQRMDTNEIVVGHRGTEQIGRDGVLTDGGMVTTRANLQGRDAIELTRRAVDFARTEGLLDGRTPKVSVTGHSLGGTLAQITSHHFDLKGETFNAYGAASLGYRIPQGGNNLVNHVMAADPVSAASPHFGQVRVYATQKEINTLAACGFSNSKANFLIPDQPVVAAGLSLGSHSLDNFLGAKSVLQSPQSRTLAEGNKRMIEEYRDDIGERRRALTVGSRGVPGGVHDVVDEIRGTLKPGEPARRDAERQSDRRTSSLEHADHPGNALFEDARRGVYAQDAKVGRAPDQRSDQLAGGLAAEMHAAGGARIDAVSMSSDAARTFAIQGRADDPAHLRVSVETVATMDIPLQQSSQRVAEQAAKQGPATQHALEQDQVLQASRSMQA